MHLLDLDNLALGLIMKHATEDKYMLLICHCVCHRFRGLVAMEKRAVLVTAGLICTPVQHGKLSIVTWLRRMLPERKQWVNEWVAECAARAGQLAIIQSLPPLDQRTTNIVYWEAARHGQLDIIKWAHRTLGFPIKDGVAFAAAEGGHLNTLQWVLQNGCKVREHFYTTLEYNGRAPQHVMDWLWNHGYARNAHRPLAASFIAF